MATTMIPTAPRPSPTPGGTRFVAIRANLMPEEIVSARQTDVVRRQVLLGLAVLVALLAAWYAYSWLQTSRANSDLDSAQRQGVAYQDQQKQYSGVVQAQADVQSIQTQLTTLMADDLQWKTMLTNIRAQATDGVTITSIAGTLNEASNVSGPPTILNQSGRPAVGTLTLSGAAPEKKSVAAYADRLAKVKGLAAPFISSIAATNNTVSFSMTVIITSDSLGGRYATSASSATTGGK